MSVTKGYRTRQRRLISSYIEKNRDRHITAKDIMQYLKNDGDSVGKIDCLSLFKCIVRKRDDS